jgi:hypothetical protein
LKPGAYDVFVSSEGFSPIAKKIEVKKGKVTTFSPLFKIDRLTKVLE